MQRLWMLNLAFSCFFVFNNNALADFYAPELPLMMEANETSDPLYIAHHAGAYSIGASKGIINSLVQSVYVASVSSGSSIPVLFGTVKVEQSQVTYQAEPKDHLVLELSGKIFTFYINRFVGTRYGSPDEFFAGNFTLAFKVQEPKTTSDISIQAEKVGNQTTCNFTGVMELNSVAYESNLQMNGDTYFENDSTGSHSRIKENVRGSIAWAGNALTLNEDSFFEFVSTTGSRRGSAATDHKLRNNQLEMASGDLYRWNQVFVQKNFKNGKPSEPTAWVGRGSVTLNNQPYGEYYLDTKQVGDQGGFIYVKLRSPVGSQTLETWQAY